MNKIYLATRENCWYDECNGLVIAAENINEARELIRAEIGGEPFGGYADEFDINEFDISTKGVILGSYM